MMNTPSPILSAQNRLERVKERLADAIHLRDAAQKRLLEKNSYSNRLFLASKTALAAELKKAVAESEANLSEIRLLWGNDHDNF